MAVIDQFPDEAGYYSDLATWRGFVLERLGRNLEAAEAFERALYTFTDLSQVGGVQFYYATRAYKAARQYCKAMRPLEQFAAFDPAGRFTADVKATLGELGALGKCGIGEAGRFDVPLSRRDNILIVNAVVNGAPAKLIVDTGASAVHLTRKFAERAGITLEQSSMVRVQGVYGSGPAYFTVAREVGLGNRVETDVRVLVASADDGLTGVDGLLGQTYLSRFKVTIDGEMLTLEPQLN